MALRNWNREKLLSRMNPCRGGVAHAVVAHIARSLLRYCTDDTVGIATIAVEVLAANDTESFEALHAEVMATREYFYARSDSAEVEEEGWDFTLWALQYAFQYLLENRGWEEYATQWRNFVDYAVSAGDYPYDDDPKAWIAIRTRRSQTLCIYVRQRFPVDPLNTTYVLFRGEYVCPEILSKFPEEFQVAWDAACERGEVHF